ncbi:MAG: acetyl-CoA synthetase [Proteobacteria bacterium]|nr:acetyl-CoA synthetase [Pseudomonadota bacterium]
MIARELGNRVKGQKRAELTEVEAKAILREAGIPVVEAKIGRSKKEVISLSREIGFPVALKIISSEVIHKSDAGGVRLALSNNTLVGKAYDEIINATKEKFPQAKIEGISVQRMAPPGVEVIIGMTKDPQFGALLMFGLGGILVEILKDVSFRIVPISRKDAREMIREIKGYPLLKGYRGGNPVDLPFLEALIMKVSSLVEKHPEIRELDINPIFAYSKGALAVDARIILEA